MPRIMRPAGPQSPRNLALLACALITATALATLLVLVITAKAQTAKSLVCPTDDRSHSVPTQVRTGARKELVPPGATGLTVCRYNGMNAVGGVPQWGLRGAGVTDDRAEIDKIVAALDALKPAHGVYSCPMDDESAAVATFGYASAPGVTVTIGTNGCNSVSNGHVHRLGLDKPVISQIEALAAKPLSGQTWSSVRGHLQLCGGPAPGRCWTTSDGVCSPHCRANRVVVTNSNGLWIAMAPVYKGSFHFTVATPGRYEFSLYADNTLLTKTRASVPAGRTTTVVFTIPVP